MKKYSVIIGIAFALIILVQSSFAQAGSNLYKVFFAADGVTTNDFGRMGEIFTGKRDLVRQCATNNGVTDLSTLTLVYDRDTDALEVVDRRTGDLICTPMSFSGGASVQNSHVTSRERLAFIFLEDSGEAAGTISGTERYRYDFDGNVIRFAFTARLHFAVT